MIPHPPAVILESSSHHPASSSLPFSYVDNEGDV